MAHGTAQGLTLCKKKAGLLTFPKLIATLWKQGKICGVCLAFFLPPPYHAQRTTFMHQKSPAYIEVVRQTKKTIWTIRQRAESMIYETFMEVVFP